MNPESVSHAGLGLRDTSQAMSQENAKSEAQPEKGKPAETPVSQRKAVMDMLKRAVVRRTSTSR